MMQGYSILMFIFAGALLLMGLLVCSGETGLIRSYNWTRVKDKKAYARFLGKGIMATAIPVVLSGVAALVWEMSAALIVLVVGIIIVLFLIANKAKKHY